MTLEVAAQSKAIIDKALTECGEIATLPEVTSRIIELVEDRSSSARDMHEVIKTDPALSARVLKVVNSAFYGLPGQIASVDRAIVLLGLSAVKNIAIAASISRMFKGQQVGANFTARDIWRHSVAVAVAGKLIAQSCGYSGPADEVFLAGLIHDLGVMVERQVFPEQLCEVVEQCAAGCGRMLDLEVQIIGADHQAFGDALTSRWKFPKNLRAVVGLHHEPHRLSSELRTFGGIIHVADVLCCQERLGFYLTASDEQVSDDQLEAIGLDPERVPEIVGVLKDELDAAEASLSGGA